MSQEKTIDNTVMPDFKIGQDKIPNLKIKSLRLENYKAFSDYTFDFTNTDGSVKKLLLFFLVRMGAVKRQPLMPFN